MNFWYVYRTLLSRDLGHVVHYPSVSNAELLAVMYVTIEDVHFTVHS